MGVTEEAGKVGAVAVEAMRSTPLAIALLMVNVAFIGFVGYIIHEVAVNGRERNADQAKLIAEMMKDCRGRTSWLDTLSPIPAASWPKNPSSP